MGTDRLEAFSDGVLAVIITIMVLELHAPHSPDLAALAESLPTFLGYVLSFVYIGIYWNNHHHLFQATDRISGAVMWANNFLLFWLSLVPFVTDWMDETHFATIPVAIYGAVLAMSGLAYFILSRVIIHSQGPESKLKKLVGNDWKGQLSLVFYLAGIGFSFINPIVSALLYASVALMWLVPDRRIEARLTQQ